MVEARSCRVRLQVLGADGKIARGKIIRLLFSRTACAVCRDVPGRFGSTSKDATDGCHVALAAGGPSSSSLQSTTCMVRVS